MAGILEGITVIDMGHVVAVPSAGAIMGDWGAEIIKVEPLSGEIERGVTKSSRVYQTIKFGDGVEVDWVIQLLNRNKRGLAVDLKKEQGKDILYKLIRAADVFMTNYEVGSLDNLKLDYATLSRFNPRLIYAILTGYGTVGPDKDKRGFDYSAAWARSGAQYLIGEPGTPPPPQRGGMMDRVTGTHMLAGILAALLHRERTGKGQKVEFSLYHSGVWTLASDVQAALLDVPMPKFDRTTAANPLWNTYRTKDDRWFQLTMLQSDVHWPDFCRALGKPELENDPRFRNMEMREQHCEELIPILDEAFASKNMREWEKYLEENNCIFGLIQTPTEVATDPQALANSFFADLHHPAGDIKLVTPPIKFCQDPASIRGPAPEIGQHTEEILLDLGYSWEEITELKEQAVIL